GIGGTEKEALIQSANAGLGSHAQAALNLLRVFGPSMQERLGPAMHVDVTVQPAVQGCRQQLKEGNEVGLAGPIGADEDVDGTQIESHLRDRLVAGKLNSLNVD